MARATSPTRKVPPSRLSTPLSEVGGVTPALVSLFARLGVLTVGDLIRHYPYRYDDLREISQISSVANSTSTEANVIGIIRQFSHVRLRGRVKSKSTAVIDDGSGQLQAIWFGRPYLARQLSVGTRVFVRGRIETTLAGAKMSVSQHRVVAVGEELIGELVPVYALTAGLPNRVVRRWIARALKDVEADNASIGELDPLPASVNARHSFRDAHWALRAIHAPASLEEAALARERLVFEEFFLLAAHAARRRAAYAGARAPDFASMSSAKARASFAADVESLMPFRLTAAQRRCVAELTADMLRASPMNRLLQGDVGSGKTAVAAAAVLLASRAGHQSAFMAPTEILAMQHFQKLGPRLGASGIKTALLVGGLRARTKAETISRIKANEVDLVVGTHALLTDDVEFSSLGLAIIDEQHRFGVLQRAELRAKAGGWTPHTLVMTATPIPRTLAQALYADLDLSVLDELPPGRRPVKTFVRTPEQKEKIFAFVREQVGEGRQAYVVCAAIDESEHAIHSAVEQAEELRRGAFAGLRVALLHGKMTTRQKDETMRLLAGGFIQVLIATTVVEVGIDVQNASVMVVLDADRFGLAQLHQLRGRVGRGAEASYCILVASERSGEERERLQILASTNDGFKVAEADFRLRGSGDLAGTRQHGQSELRLADLIRDLPVFEQAKKEVDVIFSRDPGLKTAANAALKRALDARERSASLRITS
jgi:ATP-dependent DNA helicase RecG